MEGLSLAAASPLDFAEALDDGGAPAPGMRRRLFGRYARMVAGGPGVTLRDRAGRLVLSAGLYRDTAHLEAWFAAGPALRANLVPALRIARRLMAMAASHEELPLVKCFISPKSVAGARLAAVCGFVSAGTEETPLGPCEVWTRRYP
jgi:hypothetical protein